MNIYNISTDNDDERSNLMMELYKYKIQDKYSLEEEEQHLSDIKKRGCFYEESPNGTHATSGEMDLIEFKIYLEKYQNFNDRDKEIFIQHSIKEVERYFYYIREITFAYEYENMELKLRIFRELHYEKEAVKDFIKSIDYYSLYRVTCLSFTKSEFDNIAQSGKGLHEEYKESKVIKVFRFYVLQYETILRSILLPKKSIITNENNYFISKVKQESPECYRGIKNGIERQIITIIDNNKINFDWNKTMVYKFFKIAGYTGWKNDICPYVITKKGELNPDTANNKDKLSQVKVNQIEELFKNK